MLDTNRKLTPAEIEEQLNTPQSDLDTNTLRKSKKLDYYNRGALGLSHSRVETLRGCPRKFQLSSWYELAPRRGSVTFAFGHAVGAGIQWTLAGKSWNYVAVQVIMEYDYPIDVAGTEAEQKSKKSLWHALLACKAFYDQYHAGVLGYLDGWEIARFKNDAGDWIDGVELTFVIDLGDEATYEGHIDLILYHPKRNRYLVVELKTTAANEVTDAVFGKSAQAIGYGCVIDAIANDLKATGSFDVLYLVYKTKRFEFLPLPYTKNYEDKAHFLYSVLMEKEKAQRYLELEFYPKHGSHCNSYFRTCEHWHNCDAPHDALVAQTEGNKNSKFHDVEFSEMKPTYFFHIDQLLELQETLAKYAVGSDQEVDMLLNVTNVQM